MLPRFVTKTFLSTSVALCAVLAAAPAWSASTSYTTPHIDTTVGSKSVTLGGQTFVNHGLQGMGRVPAGTLDFNGDTFGAFSGMDIIQSTWRKTATGYTGTLYSLPDRGPNQVGQVAFSDYAGRVSSFTMAFTPYTDAASLPASVSSQNQLQLTQTGGFFFRDFNGNTTTGLDPLVGASTTVTQNGLPFPGPATGPAAGKISLDAEAIRFLRDGSFYVSDEYGANTYYFDAAGKLQGVILPPTAVQPRNAAGNLFYSSVTDAATGRRLNQGMEGMAITPDGKKLVTLLQSATLQDTNGTSQQTRNNTRLLIYDISTNKTPTNPIGHYVVELPIWNSTGSGAAANRTAAQSEILALNDTQFLVLARDGNGLGVGQVNPVYKTILLVDTSAATNIAGTTFETTAAPIATNGTLNSTIRPVQQVEIVNMLNSVQLAKFGENLNNTAATRLTLGEKWEGMALVPVLDENAPQDFFLFVGNDNDFLATNCRVNGEDCSQTVDSDGHMLIYRLTLPTYVDPEYLFALNAAGPIALEIIDQGALSVAQTNTGNVMSQLNAQRRSGVAMSGLSGWVSGAYRRDDWNSFSVAGTDLGRDGFQGTIGLDYAFSPNASAGLTFGYGQQNTDGNSGFGVDAKGYSVGGYLNFTGNLHGMVGFSYSRVDLDDITRPGAYGLTALADTMADVVSGFAEIGYTFDMGQWKGGPVAGFTFNSANVAGYLERGAAGGNLTVPDHGLNSSVVTFGGEMYGEWGSVMPFGRLTYNWQLEKEANSVELKLTSAQNAMGTATVLVPNMNENFVEATAGIQGTWGRGVWHVGYTAEIGTKDRTSHIIHTGIGFAF